MEKPQDAAQNYALEAKKHPANSPARRQALQRLCSVLHKYKLFYFPTNARSKLSPKQYEEVCEEARQRTLQEICHKIDQYDPSIASVVTWVNNTILRYRIRDAESYLFPPKEESVNVRKDGENGVEWVDHIVDKPKPGKEHNLEFEALIQFIDLDPEKKLQKHIKNKPEITFQVLLQERILDVSWEEISVKFETKLPTLSSFFQRQLAEHKSYLQRCLDNINYA